MQELLRLLEDLPHLLILAILFGGALLVGTFVALVVYPLLRAAGERTNSFTLKAFVNRTRNSAFWIVVFVVTLSFWASTTPAEGSEDWIFHRPLVFLTRTLLYFTAGIFLIRLVAVGADSLRHRYSIDEQNNLRERKILTQLQYIQKIAGVIIFVVISALILMQFDTMRSLGTTLLTSAGVGGIIIGFAAQKSIANLLAGFQIAFTQPIRLDDALIVNGEYGWVEEITMTYVTMRLWDQRRQIVPLQKFIDDTFQNWTRTNSELIGTVFLYLDYSFPMAELRAELDRWLPTQELWDERVKSVAVTDNNDRAMTVRILVSSNNAGNTFDLRCRTREYLIGWCQQNYPNGLARTRVQLEGQGAKGDAPKAYLDPLKNLGDNAPDISPHTGDVRGVEPPQTPNN